MPRPASSQWDFGGELFPKEATRRVFSVSELTADIRRVLATLSLKDSGSYYNHAGRHLPW